MKTICFLSCLLYAATLTDGDIIKAEGFEGRNVSFQCSHRNAWANNKYLCKDPCKSTEDTLVTVESGRRAESGRITLVDSGDGSFTVTFSHLQLSDSQTYWCAVDRFVFDTFTEVRLTVKKAPESERTVVPDVRSTWTDQNTNPTHFTTIKPTELSTALNVTSEELKITTGTIVYATVGSVALVFVLLLAVCVRKYRKASESKIKVPSNIALLSNANERAVSSDYSCPDNRRNHSQTSESPSVASHKHKQDPLTPNSSYENISFSKLPADSGFSPTENQNDYDNYYINSLPALKYKRTGDGAHGTPITKHKMCKNTESCTNSASPHVSKAPCEPTKEPRSLWFGLDLSRINESLS